MRLFVFAIGGTGARVLRSLVMLLAAGAKTPDNLMLVPILLDMDMQNGDTVRTVKTIELYRTIHQGTYKKAASDNRSDFFCTPIEPLGSQNTQNSIGNIGDTFFPPVVEHRGTFEDFLKVHSMDDIDLELLRSLYDASNDPASQELKLNLSVGFKGNPNIGSVVFNSLEDSPFFKQFLSAFNIDTDRIFIISSIFGGTGSSGFPQLVKLLQENNRKAPILKAKKGAVTVMPYFSLISDEKSAIDPDRFYSKSKAALTYYQNQLKLDALYYIGDNAGKEAYPNIEGGKQQLNPSHVIEMLAAEAVLDFAKRKPDELKSGRTFLEYGLRQNARKLSFIDFGKSTYDEVLLPILRLAYAAKIFTDFVPKNLNESFAAQAGLNLAVQQTSDSIFATLGIFLGRSEGNKMQSSFVDWLMEMAANDRSLNLFNYDSDFNSFVRAKQIEITGTFAFLGYGDRGINDEFLLRSANEIEKKLQVRYGDPEPRLINLLMQMADRCINKLGTLNRQIA